MVHGNLLPIIIAKASKAFARVWTHQVATYQYNHIDRGKNNVEVPDSTDGIKLKKVKVKIIL
jgi:hypothetical protein